MFACRIVEFLRRTLLFLYSPIFFLFSLLASGGFFHWNGESNQNDQVNGWNKTGENKINGETTQLFAI